ncbi:hypothetical protein AMATHDRAFT_69029 [Amanita thiersii Skay4041]|uniref:ATP-dependent RNA helicase n=1 Tax=Amanita thiersii Skay4041 TaxID=703135 RepID=A0A2A9NGD8_9AGAR|nr:hypothetical protein AMATHDRAFT_69029 [Amanita thiersii Skay4041]
MASILTRSWTRTFTKCSFNRGVSLFNRTGQRYLLARPCLATTSTIPFALAPSRYSTASAATVKPDDIPRTDTHKAHKAVDDESSDFPSFTTLETCVHPNTLKAIVEQPFKLTTMSPVQAKVLPLLPGLAQPYDSEQLDSSPRDLMVKAKTGTGKTLAFLVPAIEARLAAIEKHAKQAVQNAGLVSDRGLEMRAARQFATDEVGTLVISPTRELATQIANEAQKLTMHHNGFGVQLFVGGESKRGQLRDWSRGRRDIVVATPGRLRDMLENEPEVKKAISKTRLLILDEADSLLEMGFRDDIDAITEHLPPTPQRQTFLFSATVSRAIQQVARATLSPKHTFINCVTQDDSPVHTHIKQYHTVLPSAADQLPHVLKLLAHDQLVHPGASKTIVFLPTTKMTQLYGTFLRELKETLLPAGRHTRIYEMHSKKAMDVRTRMSADFRLDKSGAAVMVTSDVSARGVDYPDVTRVIQVGIPMTGEQYIHRVGRTGRGTNAREGRGDLVLLPWEMGFVTWQLTDVPLKPVTTGELEKQLKEMAENMDTNPRAYFRDNNAPPKVVQKSSGHEPRFGAKGRVRISPVGPALFENSPYAEAVDKITDTVNDLKVQMDEEAVNETFMSLLGYYAGKTAEIRIDKRTLLEGCKQWAVDAGGLPQMPVISATILNRLGFSGNSPMRGGGMDNYSRDRPRRSFGMRKSNYDEGRFSDDRMGGQRRERRSEGRDRAFGQWRNEERRVQSYERKSRDTPHWMGRGGRRRGDGDEY